MNTQPFSLIVIADCQGKKQKKELLMMTSYSRNQLPRAHGKIEMGFKERFELEEDKVVLNKTKRIRKEIK